MERKASSTARRPSGGTASGNVSHSWHGRRCKPKPQKLGRGRLIAHAACHRPGPDRLRGKPSFAGQSKDSGGSSRSSQPPLRSRRRQPRVSAAGGRDRRRSRAKAAREVEKAIKSRSLTPAPTHTACLTKYSSFNDYSRFLYKMLLVPVHEPKEYVQTNSL